MDGINRAMSVARDNLAGLPQQSAKLRPCILPTTISEGFALREWAAIPAPPAPRATRSQILDMIEHLDASLPSQNADEGSAEKRISVLANILAEYTADEVAFMARTAVKTLKWFPTVVECLEIIKRYRAPATEQEIALSDCRHFLQAKLEAFRVDMAEGKPIAGDIPERWKRIAENDGSLRLLPDGTFEHRRTK